MNNRIRQASAVILLLALAAGTASCGEAAGGPEQNTSGAVGNETEVQTEDTAPVINWESANLPVKDFGGGDFVILTADVADKTQAWRMVAPEETSGEALNDALFNRNQKIGDLYNLNIKSVYNSAPHTELNKAVMANDGAYDAAFGQIHALYPLAQEGKLMNWYEIPHINLEAPWWDHSVIDQLTYRDKLFVLTGDISPATDVRVYSLVFNKDLCRALDLEMPYQYVLDGTWTFDRLNQYIEDVNYDLNGDGVMDYEDRWGYFSQDGNSFMMYCAGGGTVVELDKNGDYQLTFNTPRNVEMTVKALEISIDKTKTLMANQYVADHGGQWAAASSWFAAGGSLMRSSVFEPVPRDYRAMDTDFGVLPYPKLDEQQKTYYTPAEEYSLMFCVPTTADAEKSGLIFESLAAESVSTVAVAFYDVCLNGKSVRDEESSAMLDILFANKVFDIGIILNIGSFKTKLTELETAGSTDVTSMFASIQSSAESALNKLVEKLDALE